MNPIEIAKSELRATLRAAFVTLGGNGVLECVGKVLWTETRDIDEAARLHDGIRELIEAASQLEKANQVHDEVVQSMNVGGKERP